MAGVVLVKCVWLLRDRKTSTEQNCSSGEYFQKLLNATTERQRLAWISNANRGTMVQQPTTADKPGFLEGENERG